MVDHKLVEISLPSDYLKRLAAIAKVNDLTVGELFSKIIVGWLKDLK